MTPNAFEALVLQLSTTVAFQHITNSHKVRQQVAVGLYHLGHSGNGGGVCDIAFACGCSWGTSHIKATIHSMFPWSSFHTHFALLNPLLAIQALHMTHTFGHQEIMGLWLSLVLI